MQFFREFEERRKRDYYTSREQTSTLLASKGMFKELCECNEHREAKGFEVAFMRFREFEEQRKRNYCISRGHILIQYEDYK